MYRQKEFRFSDEIEKELQRAFKELKKKRKSDPKLQKKINGFITLLERDCNLMKKRMELPSPAEQRDDLEDTLQELKVCVHKLKSLPHIHWNMWLLDAARKFYDLSNYKKYNTPQKVHAEMENRVNALKDAKKSLNALIRMIEQFIDEIKVKEGHPEADSFDFIYAIAKLMYVELSIRPTTTRDGFFAEIVRISHEAIGLPLDYPRAAIKKAVDRVKLDLIPHISDKSSA
jgi:hypothetical protein